MKDLQRRLDLEEEYSHCLQGQVRALHKRLFSLTNCFVIIYFDTNKDVLQPALLAARLEDGVLYTAVSLNFSCDDIVYDSFPLMEHWAIVHLVKTSTVHGLQPNWVVQFASNATFSDSFFVFKEELAMQCFLSILG